jgi:threonine/homoserine/homoserine lactone efflux protein
MFNWVSFIAYALATTSTPGPNTISSMSNASRHGLKAGLTFNLGIWVGFSIVMLICTAFCKLLAEIIPVIQPVLLVVGAAYILYLAWNTYRAGRNIDTKDKSKGGGFWGGFVLQFVNPKIYIYGIVSMESYILPCFSESPLVLVLLALLLAFIGFCMTLMWALFGSVFKVLFSKYSRITNTVMALLLVYCAVALFI